MNEIVKRHTAHQHELAESDKKLSLLLEFEGLESLIRAYEVNEWTPDDEMKELMDIARNSSKDATRLAAIKTLQARRIEILKHAGLIISATQTREGPDGTKTILSTERVRSLLSGEANYGDTQKETETQITEGTPQATGSQGDADSPAERCGPSRETSQDGAGDDRREEQTVECRRDTNNTGKRARGPGGRFLKQGIDRGKASRDSRGIHQESSRTSGDRNDGNSEGRGTDTGHTRSEPEIPDIPIALDRPPTELLLPGLARSIRKAALSPNKPTKAGG